MVAAFEPRELYIGGQWVAPKRGEYLPVVNPATEKEIGELLPPYIFVASVHIILDTRTTEFERDSSCFFVQNLAVWHGMAIHIRGLVGCEPPFASGRNMVELSYNMSTRTFRLHTLHL